MKKSWSRWTGTLLATTVLAGAVWGGGFASSAQAANTTFSDVKANHWAASSIAAGVAKGYVAGYTNGTFKPDASVTRSEFVKMVVSALNVEVGNPSGKWYAPYVAAAASEGLYQNADFANNDAAWNKTITRQEMARIAARAAGETSKENDKWMYLATKKGLITGVGKGEIALEGLSTRAQAVVVIERILSANEGKKLSVDTYAVGSAEIAWHGTNIFTVMPEIFKNPEEWNENLMTIDSKDGMYRSQMTSFVAIDLSDKNDPNLSLLGNVNDYYWYNSDPNRKLKINEQKNSYILLAVGSVVYNKNPKVYSDTTSLRIAIDGLYSKDDKAFYERGILNAPTLIYKNRFGDTSAYIIPKTGWESDGKLKVLLRTPSLSNYGFKENVLLSTAQLQ